MNVFIKSFCWVLTSLVCLGACAEPERAEVSDEGKDCTAASDCEDACIVDGTCEEGDAAPETGGHCSVRSTASHCLKDCAVGDDGKLEAITCE